MAQRSTWIGLAIVVACGGTLFSIRIEETTTITISEASLVESLLTDIGFEEFTSLDLTDSEELQNQGVEPGDIRETFLVEFSLEAVDPPGSDLSFIDALEVYVEAPDLPRVLIASQDSFPMGEALIDFELEGIDLTPYVVSQSMTLTTDAAGRRPDEATQVEALFALSVGVTSQGVCNQL